MFKIIIFVVYLCVVLAYDDDAFKDVDQLVKKYGYDFEEHIVKTSDGYLLGVHRIPNNNNDKVVLIMHQFLTSSADFVSTGNRSLAFFLADNGYDVWLGNARGNTYSSKHETLDPNNNNEFWQFTFDDVARKDLPAIIDFILTETEANDIFYIGHGQGCGIFYIMASEMPEYEDKVKRMLALAPMAHMNNMPNPLFKVMNTALTIIDENFTLNGIMNMLISISSLLNINLGVIFARNEDYIFVKLCDDDSLLVEVCAAFISLIYGFDDAQLEREKIPVILTNAYAGSSFTQLAKYVNFYLTDKFSKTYQNLNNISVNNAIFYARNDWLVAVEDVETLATNLNSSLELKYEIPYKDFNHIDFLFAKDVIDLVYLPLLKYLEGKNVKIEL